LLQILGNHIIGISTLLKRYSQDKNSALRSKLGSVLGEVGVSVVSFSCRVDSIITDGLSLCAEQYTVVNWAVVGSRAWNGL